MTDEKQIEAIARLRNALDEIIVEDQTHGKISYACRVAEEALKENK